MNHGLRTYQSSSRSFTYSKKKNKMTKIAVLSIFIADSYGPLWLQWDTLWMKDHSRNTVHYPKSLRIQAFESLEAFRMYYAIGVSVSSLHRESTDSYICKTYCKNHSNMDIYRAVRMFTCIHVD